MPKPLPDHSKLILEEHIQNGLSLRAIERKHGLANGALSRYAKIMNLPVRTKAQQAKTDFSSGRRQPKSGEDHWAFGMTKETSSIHAAHSERMKSNNPVYMDGVIERALATKEATGFSARAAEWMRGRTISDQSRQKLAKSMAPVLAKQISEREKIMQAALAFDESWIFQHSTTYHILDFARADMKVAFEVDTGSSKLERSAKRDAALVGDGWTIFRIRYDSARDTAFFRRLFRVAEKCIPDFDCPDKAPALARNKYRVVIRCPENPSGFHANGPDDPALIELAARIRNRLEGSGMRQD